MASLFFNKNIIAAMFIIYMLAIGIVRVQAFPKASQESLIRVQAFPKASQESLINESESRNKRSTDPCPVHPDTPVILDDKETYFDFDANEPVPAPMPGDTETLSCPAKFGSWWPGVTKNLRAVCPWSWTTFDTWSIVPDVYPRYVTQAKCLCQSCVNAKDFGCQKLRRKFQFYRKTGCQGNKPVFFAAKMDITVGCYCAH